MNVLTLTEKPAKNFRELNEFTSLKWLTRKNESATV